MLYQYTYFLMSSFISIKYLWQICFDKVNKIISNKVNKYILIKYTSIYQYTYLIYFYVISM